MLTRTLPTFRPIHWLLALTLSGLAMLPFFMGRAAADAPELVEIGEHLLAVSDEPLGNREPLLLVHGIAPTAKNAYNFNLLIDAMQAEPAIAKRYKIYLFPYNSSLPVETNTRVFKTTFEKLVHDTGAKRVHAVVQSMGGLFFRNLMNDDFVQSHTGRVIAIAVPFHGTPLANERWVADALNRGPFFSAFRLSKGLVYSLTGRLFPTFANDFHWDDYDGAIPETLQRKQAKLNAANASLPPYRRVTDAETANYVFYAGYSEVAEPLENALRNSLGLENLSGDAPRASFMKPFSKHHLLSVGNHSMARLSFNPVDGSLTPTFSPLHINDGVSPITSQLWLGRFIGSAAAVKTPTGTDDDDYQGKPTKADAQQSYIDAKKQWEGLKMAKKAGNSRLFPDLDHRDWLDATTRIHGQEKVSDLFHSDAPARSVNDWIIHDLLRAPEAG